MAKLSPTPISSQYGGIAAINANFQAIADELNGKVLYRDNPPGEPNTLETDVDCNRHRLLNLPDPVSDTEPATKGWLVVQENNAAVSAIEAAGYAAEALGHANNAEESANTSVNAASIIVDWEYLNTWTTGVEYKKNNIVAGNGSYAGWSLIALVDHVSSGANIDADYGTGKWGVLSQRGPAGPGSGDMLGSNNLSDVVSTDLSLSNLGGTSVGKAVFTAASVSAAQQALDLEVGVDVQAYDADTAKTDVAQAFTAPQRSALLTDNDGNFDLSAKQNFKCTPTAGITLTFSSQADGLSGSVVFVNGANYAIAAHANTKLTASDLTKLSVTGTYRIDYLSDGTNAYCSVVGAYA